MTVPPDRILLTGASGFVGRHLTAALSAAYPDATLITPAVDIRDAAAIAAAVEDASPEICFHLAAVSSVAAAARDEDLTWQVNLHGTLHLARAIRRHAPNCVMLFVSSADAYGSSFRAGSRVTEDTALAPMNVYSASKAAADLALGSMAVQGLRVVRLRTFNHTGPGQSAEFVVPAFARQIARIAAGRQPPLLRVGNLDTWRDFLDVRDVCRAYVACVDRRDTVAPGTILNLASGQAHRIGDMLNELRDMAGVEIEVQVDQSRVRESDLRMACGDATRAREVLGWAPAIPWNVTLRDVLTYWHGRVSSEAGEA
ncbi:MAG: GDP-mannose 4,6-dehydratase [Acetobacteraceae bacterium]|jgi:nucleoside-diphosphate-sugar epimerase